MGNYRAYRKLYGTARWQRVRKRVFQRDGYRCSRCGLAGVLEAHHDPPLAKRPVISVDEFYNPDRIKTLCRACHLAEHRELDPERAAWDDYLRTL